MNTIKHEQDKKMKVAIIHYWWLLNRGGEAVAAALLELYPEADLFVHVHDEEILRKAIGKFHKGKIINTFIANMPFSSRFYKMYLPFMPMALEQLDMSKYDLIISNESGPTKGIISRPDAIHICYCLSPMRYIWDMYNDYLDGESPIKRFFFRFIAHNLRIWDRLSADRVDYFVSISNFIASRVSKFYRRESIAIIPCPVDADKFDHKRKREDFYLCLGQLVRYKKADIAVEAFNRLDLPLVVIGEGELFKELSEIANENITLMGWQEFSVVKEKLETCKALIFPGVEDFGIVPLEAMAAGAPVIAYARGGALDTVVDHKTGILFHEQTSDDLVRAINEFESDEIKFEAEHLKKHAQGFDKSVFKNRISELVNSLQ